MSMPDDKRLRVLYGFPYKIGADRICTTAWYQVASTHTAGADVACDPGVVHRSPPEGVHVRPTLARGRARIPYRGIGQRARSAASWAALRPLVGVSDPSFGQLRKPRELSVDSVAQG